MNILLEQAMLPTVSKVENAIEELLNF